MDDKNKRNFNGIHYISMFLKETSEIIKSKEISDKQIRILFYLAMTRTQYGNRMTFDYKKVCSELDISERTLRRAIKQFIDMRVLIENKNADFGYDYSFNPFLGFRGNGNNKPELIKLLGGYSKVKVKHKEAEILNFEEAQKNKTNTSKKTA